MTEANLNKKKIKTKKNKKDRMSQEAYEVASQWKLMWWKFKKHKMAMIAAPIVICLYLMAIFADFLSPYTPDMTFPHKDTPPTKIHFTDKETGKFSLQPFVYDVKMVVDQKTFKRIYTDDTSKKLPIKFWAKGEPYKFWGLFKTDRHLFGLEVKDKALFLMGTDKLGRDLFSRLLYGSRISLSFGLVSIFFTFLIGLLLGGLSGYLGGIVDTVIQRIIDLLICMPTIPLWMALAAALPRDWSVLKIYFGMIIIMSLIGWTGLARTVRGKILSLREEDFTMAASLAGASDFRIITKHLLPSFASYIIVSITLSIPGSILGETSLSFLGLGLQAPAVSWGVLLQDAQNLETLAFHPWLLWPAAFIILTVLMFNFLGDGLRDAADPYK
jgi:peptide/nickel transport system permease protein